jgi:hypothetical protein
MECSENRSSPISILAWCRIAAWRIHSASAARNSRMPLTGEAFLCRDDRFSGISFDHRRGWIAGPIK